MSGYPNQTQVAELRSDILRMTELEGTISVLKEELDSLKVTLKDCESEYSRRSDNVWKLMQKMDVHTSQNFGWEARMNVFLKELITPENKLCDT